MIIAAIVACEVGFWVVLAAGLLARYALRLPRLGGFLLLCVPLVDLALLGLRRGRNQRLAPAGIGRPCG